ncbi:polymerase P1 [red clover-associated luteovirus]|nr:polymerase P1 [red clover-associated luteovirus]AVX32313.1 polymerase P1 [red clover-associated luteovirus]AVX32318.1 polymerase P1 [red clover-associated luteovirus]AVX32323.1 polymerase P1 [red clover-associated luteovirus]
MSMVFDALLTASIKAVKDFVSYCFSSSRAVYKALKKWVWELQGKFSQYDSFVCSVYGAMDDVEAFEFECLEAVEEANTAFLLARSKLQELTSTLPYKAPPLQSKIQGFPMPTRPLGAPHEEFPPTYPSTPLPTCLVEESLPECFQLKKAQKDYAVAAIEKQQAKEDAIEIYEENFGKAFFKPLFRSLASRLAHVKKAQQKRNAVDLRAKKIAAEANYIEDIPELLSLTTAHEVETGILLPAKTKTNPRTEEVVELPREKEKTWVRTLINEPQSISAAKKWVRAAVCNKNRRLLNSDEISAATIQRYIEQLCEDAKLDVKSTKFLVEVGLRHIPIPTNTDITTAMVVHCPEARRRRAELDAITSSVF